MPFPWDALRAETLRSMCKDLRAGPAAKRKRDDMILFLKGIEKQGIAAALSDGNPNAGVPTTASSEPTSVNKSIAEPQDANQIEDHDMSNSTCDCQEGWLSPRLKFILSTTAVVASDLILDTGEMAEEFGHAGGVYLTQYIPEHLVPRGKSIVLWIEGFAMIFGIIHTMFEAGTIPTPNALDYALSQLPRDKQRLVKAYRKQSAEVDSVLEALVCGAMEEWENNDFEATHCDEKWDALPVCAEHDLNWGLAEHMLIG